MPFLDKLSLFSESVTRRETYLNRSFGMNLTQTIMTSTRYKQLQKQVCE